MESNTLDRKRSATHYFLIFASFFLYVILAGAKNLYVAEKTTLAEVFAHLENPLTAIAATMEYYFYTYAAMQIILVFVMKKINIKWFLSLTVALSAVLTALMAFTNTIEQHYIIYVIMGFFQAGIWGCIMKILAEYLPTKLLPFSNALMTSGPAVAGLVSYGVAALFGDNWKTPFLLLGIILFLFVIVFFISVSAAQRFPRVPSTHAVVHDDGTTETVDDEADQDFIHLDSRKRIVVFYAASILLGFLLTSLFILINNNLDLYLKEIAGFSNSLSKLLTILAPVSIVIGPILAVRFCEKHKNFITVSLLFFAASLLFAILAVLFFKISAMLSLVFILFFLVLTNGGRSVSLSIAGVKMRSKIDTGVYTTAVNASASIASGIAPKIITVFLDNTAYTTEQSWSISLWFTVGWNAVTVIVMAGCIAWIKIINKKRKEAIENCPQS